MQKAKDRPRPGVQLWKVPEAAIELNLSVRSVWRLIAEGHLRTVRAGRSVRIPAEGRGSIAEFIEKGGAR